MVDGFSLVGSSHGCQSVQGQQTRDVVVFDIAALEHMAHMPREQPADTVKKMAIIPPYTCPRPSRSSHNHNQI
eukprot:4876309-Amphidinium_carterae.1